MSVSWRHGNRVVYFYINPFPSFAPCPSEETQTLPQILLFGLKRVHRVHTNCPAELSIISFTGASFLHLASGGIWRHLVLCMIEDGEDIIDHVVVLSPRPSKNRPIQVSGISLGRFTLTLRIKQQPCVLTRQSACHLYTTHDLF